MKALSSGDGCLHCGQLMYLRVAVFMKMQSYIQRSMHKGYAGDGSKNHFILLLFVCFVLLRDGFTV